MTLKVGGEPPARPPNYRGVYMLTQESDNSSRHCRLCPTDTPPRFLKDVPAPEVDTCLRSFMMGEGAPPFWVALSCGGEGQEMWPNMWPLLCPKWPNLWATCIIK
jgi:hypothetical protein